MNVRAFFIVTLLFALLAPRCYGQTAPHSGASEAFERIVLERDFGNNLKFHSREALTFEENPIVPGLNGLMFIRWKGADPEIEVIASVLWFDETNDLLQSYRAETARSGLVLLPIGDTVIWKTSEHGYLWTDGEHFLVGLGGSSTPPREMLEAWLALIESNPPDLSGAGSPPGMTPGMMTIFL